LSIKTHGGIRSLASLLLIVFMCLFAVELYMKFTATSLWDDSYMFIRYADGFLSEGRLVFNPGGPQAYGLTSPAFLAVLIPIRMLLHDDPTLPLLLGSGIAGLLFAGLIALTVIRLTSGTGAAVARGAAVLTCFTAAYASSDLAVHFTSGMDTTLAMAFLAFFIILNTPGNRLNPGRTAILSGILGGAAFLVRPDLLVFTLCTPAVVILYSRGAVRRRAAVSLAISCMVLAVTMLLCRRYLNSPLPLAFYVKFPGFYGDRFMSLYRLESFKQLVHFLLSYPVPIGVIALGCASNPGNWFRSLSVFQRGLLVSASLFVIYELFFVTQIMAFSQRFFYPALVPMATIAASSGVFLHRRFRDWQKSEAMPVPGDLGRLGSAAVALVLFFTIVPVIGRQTMDLQRFRAAGGHIFNIEDEYSFQWVDYWPYLDEFSKLPDDLVMAATEIGHILALNRGKTVIDMSGLNETHIAHNGFDPEYLIERYDPDLIYMPHQDYGDMWDLLTESVIFTERYVIVHYPDEEVVLDIAVNRRSGYYWRIIQTARGTGRTHL